MPLILTLGFDSASFARLEPLRQRHFPPYRNFIPVHVTLFQQLPAGRLPDLLATLAREAAATPPLPFAVTGLLDLGGGAALALDCPPAGALHNRLRDAWRGILTASDDRARKLHVTLQNKATRDAARATLAALCADFTPWRGLFDRLILWHYRGGPWERAATLPLSGETP